MNRLRNTDLEQLSGIGQEAKCTHETIATIENFVKAANKRAAGMHELNEDEIKEITANKTAKCLMILFFLTKNVALEFLRRKKEPYRNDQILINNIWYDIKEILVKKLLLSRDIQSYFQPFGGINSEEFTHFVNAAKTIKIIDLVAEEFVSNNAGNTKFRLDLRGKYEVVGTPGKHLNPETYTLHDRKTCFHEGLYDPFKFEDNQTWMAYRYLNNSEKRKLINSVFTLKYALPELTILNNDGSYLKISAEEIPGFMKKKLADDEIDNSLYEAVKKDYLKLFLPPMDVTTLQSIYQKIKPVIEEGERQSVRVNKPLLILLSEIHGSKESFLLHTIILLIASNRGIKHLSVETINIYHEKYGWDAQVNEIKRLMVFAQENLAMHVQDLEGYLHYQNQLSPYPYHEIPEQEFGIEVREASWISDVTALKKANIMIVGAGHLNNLLNSELKNSYYLLPIDCTSDKDFSDMLSISQHNFIAIENSTQHLSLDEILAMVEKLLDS